MTRPRQAGRVMVLLLAAGALASPAAAEDRARTWVGLGFGMAGGGHGEGIALTATLVHQQRAHYFAVRGSIVADPFDESGDSSTDLAVLYGRAVRGRYAHAALATGVSVVALDLCGRTGSPCTTIGLPLVAEAAVQPLPILGLGVQAFANLNARGSSAGVAVFLQVGWMP